MIVYSNNGADIILPSGHVLAPGENDIPSDILRMKVNDNFVTMLEADTHIILNSFPAVTPPAVLRASPEPSGMSKEFPTTRHGLAAAKDPTVAKMAMKMDITGSIDEMRLAIAERIFG